MAPERTPLPVRVALVAVALAAVGFLGIGLRAAAPQAQGRELIGAELDGATYRRALSLFRDAQRLNPDTDPELLEAGLLLVAGEEPREAAAVIEGVVRREPENSKAWALLANATAEIDPRRAREARVELRRVKPPVESGP